MPSTIARNLNLCFSKFIGSLETDDSPPMSPTSSTHHHHHNRPFPTTAATSPSIFIKNFNSLYDHTFDYSTSSSLSTASTSFYPEPESEPPADLATAFASQRFFFSSPGRSNSIIESTECSRSLSSSSIATSAPAEPDRDKKLFNDSVAVPTYSPDPYLDFRRSMQEMVEARPELKDVKSSWERLHELLLCYLALNPKSTHKFIVGAFADLLVSLMSQSNGDDVTASVAVGGDGGGGGC